MDERHLVDMACQVRKDFGDVFATLAMLAKTERRAHDRPDLLAEEAGILIEADQFLAVAAVEFGLVIPGINVARPAVDEEPDDVFGLRSMMSWPRQHGACRIGGRPRRLSYLRRGTKHVRQREHAEPAAGACQEFAAGGIAGIRGSKQLADVLHRCLVPYFLSFGAGLINVVPSNSKRWPNTSTPFSRNCSGPLSDFWTSPPGGGTTWASRIDFPFSN